jgi:hypothetical protein
MDYLKVADYRHLGDIGKHEIPRIDSTTSLTNGAV